MKKYIQNQAKAINSILKTWDPEEVSNLVERCLATLKNGGSIIASGLGKNVPICEKFTGTMNSLGMRSRFLHTNTAIHGDVGMVEIEDLVILVSKSMRSEETLKLHRHLEELGIEVYVLTSNLEFTTNHLYTREIHLEIDDEGDGWNLLPINSTLVYLTFFQALALELRDRMNISIDVVKRTHPGGNIGRLMTEV